MVDDQFQTQTPAAAHMGVKSHFLFAHITPSKMDVQSCTHEPPWTERGQTGDFLPFTHTLTHVICGLLDDTLMPDWWRRVLTGLVMHTVSSFCLCVCV